MDIAQHPDLLMEKEHDAIMALHNNPWGMMQSNESCMWKHFQCLKMETKKKEKKEKNKNMYKSKKAPLREGPNEYSPICQSLP